MKRGRPPLPPAERRTYVLQVPLSEAERAALETWAGGPVAPAVRALVLRAARKPSRKPAGG